MPRTVSISTVPFDGYPLETALARIAALGVTHVELAYIQGYMDPFDESAFSDQQVRALRAMLSRSGLRCFAFSAHLNLGAVDVTDIFSRRLGFAAAIGARIVVSNAAPRADRSAFETNIAALAERAANLGLKIALENPSAGPDNLIDTGRGGADLIERLGLPNVGLNYDFATDRRALGGFC